MNLKYDGNGRSKDDAISFTNANAFFDHIEMQNEYIEQNNIEVNSRSVSGNLRGTYVYDVFDTPEGKRWFKVPNNIIQ